tara:strand:+ start:2130 stop:2384 length:255 start_codon:yes stop_codon:yes gene_type:complete
MNHSSRPTIFSLATARPDAAAPAGAALSAAALVAALGGGGGADGGPHSRLVEWEGRSGRSGRIDLPRSAEPASSLLIALLTAAG